MRSHGWSGNTPRSDEEAINRILDAADDIIAERGSAMRIADVARALGVTRQTVYRYFPGTAALLVACAMRSADGFLEKLAGHVKGESEPVAAVIEGLAFTIESLAQDSQLGMVLGRQEGGTIASLTSDTALTFGRAMLHRFDVDWDAHGYDENALAEMAEFCIRVVHSILIDPGNPAREGDALREFLSRWVGPAIAYPDLARAMTTLSPTLARRPRRTRRNPAS